MRVPPLPDLEQQLRRHGGALRTLAGELVRDPATADDAVQQTWLAALQRAPRHGGSFGGWLRTVLVHVVSRQRRAERRRAHHEGAAAAARGLLAEDAAAGPAREEVAAGLLAAVRALEQPYRDAIWERWFEGKPPRAIAAASGVPLATVKSRLQRGLGMLRAQLGERDAERGTDWRAALVGAFALEKETAAATGAGAAAAVIGGGVLVATWLKVALAAAAIALASLWWWPRDPDLPRTAPATRVDSAPVVASAPGDTPRVEATASLAAPASERAPTPREEVTPVASSAQASVVGRCVDAAGRPVAGCRVLLRGHRDSVPSMDGPRSPGTGSWRDPEPATSSGDGTFALAVSPPPSFRFSLEVDTPPYATLRVGELRLEAGAATDLGDVRIQPGVRVRGRLVDAAGAPCRFGGAAIQREPRNEANGVQTVGYMAARCRDDGSFEFQSVRFAPGTYRVTASDASLEAPPQRIVLTGDTPVVDLAFVLPGVQVAHIAGVVVDENDTPVDMAQVRVEGMRRPEPSGPGGKFLVRRPDAAAVDPAILTVEAAGFATVRSAPIAWGTEDARIVMRNSGTLDVIVLGSGDTPVEDFTVRCAPCSRDGAPGLGSSRSGALRVRARGPFPDGSARVDGVFAGDWRLVIEFPEALDLPPWIEQIAVPEGGLRHVVRVDGLVTRTVRIVRGDGTPVAGTKVQAIDTLAVPLGSSGGVLPMVDWVRVQSNRRIPVVVLERTTDGDGRVSLRAPRAARRHLRVLGPGHAPRDLGVVAFERDGGDELVVEVARGARWVGRITPPDAMARLTPTPRTGPDRYPLPRLRLRGTREQAFTTGGWLGEDSPSVVIAPDGTFVCEDQPGGTWTAFVEFMRSFDGTNSSSARVDLATVELVAGQETRTDLDLGFLMPAEFEGRVLWNGAPFTSGEIMVHWRGRHADGSREAWSSGSARTDATGSFRRAGPPGELSVALKTTHDGTELHELLVVPAARMVAGESSSHVFAIDTGTLAVTVRDAQGQPAAGVVVWVNHGQARLPPTDAAGAAKGIVPAGALILSLLQRAGAGSGGDADAAAQRVLEMRMHSEGDRLPWTTLGTVDVAMGRDSAIELRLPADHPSQK